MVCQSLDQQRQRESHGERDETVQNVTDCLIKGMIATIM